MFDKVKEKKRLGIFNIRCWILVILLFITLLRSRVVSRFGRLAFGSNQPPLLLAKQDAGVDSNMQLFSSPAGRLPTAGLHNDNNTRQCPLAALPLQGSRQFVFSNADWLDELIERKKLW